MKKFLLFLFSLGLIVTTSKAQVLNTSFCQTNGQVRAVAIDSVNNVVYIGGSFTSVCGQARSRIAALNLNTGALLPWNPGANSDVFTLYVYHKALYVGGMFTTIGGQSRMYAAKFYIPSGTITSWSPAITTGSWVYSFAGHGNKIYMGGDFLLTVSTGSHLCELDTGTAAATTWADANLNNTVFSLAVDGNSLYVAGSYTNVASSGINYLSKFNLSGGGNTLDASWDALLDGNCTAICAQSGRLFIGGGFSFLNTDPRNYIGEVDTSSAAATSWNPNFDLGPTQILYRAGRIYAVGNFGTVGGISRPFIAAVNATTGSLDNWNINCGGSAFAAATYGTQIFIGGGMSSVLGQTRNNFAVVCINPIDDLSGPPSGPADVCTGITGVSYSVATALGATTYSWSYSGTGVTINGNTNSVTLDFSASATSGTLSVQATNGCESSSTQTISINTYTLSTPISGNNSIMCGDSSSLSVSDNYLGSGSLSYSWTPASGLSNTNSSSVMAGPHVNKTYTINVSSTEGCSSSSTFTLTVSPFNVNLTQSMTSILCSTSDSIYAVNDYPGAGTVTYTWTPTTGLNLSNPSIPVASPVTTTDYTVMANSSDGCSASAQSITVVVDPITLSPGPSGGSITCGNTTTLTVSDNYPGSGSLTYTWSPAGDLSNANVMSPVASPTTNTTYSIDVTTTEGCTSSASVNIFVNPLQIFTAGLITTTCTNPVVLNTSNNSGNTNLTYSWTPSTGMGSTTIQNPLVHAGTTTVYTVTMSLPGSGCADATEVDTVKISSPPVPSICMVTGTDSSKFNVIIWDKTGYLPTDKFVVYREVSTNTYLPIGTVPYDSLSQFIDTTRHVGPANGNPNVGTYRYKISAMDSCGNESMMSPFHNSVYFVDNHTGTFTWNLYVVENMTVTPVTTFDLERDNNNTGSWIVIGTVAGTQTTLNDPNYSTYQSVANWRVTANGFNCTPTMRQQNGTQTSIIKSKSNITNNRGIGVKQNMLAAVEIYPNPSSGVFEIDFGNASGKISVKIVSLLGEEIYFASVNASEKLKLDLSNNQSGVYIVQLTGSNGTLTKRIIKN